MKSVGEAMGIGKTFKQSFQKAIRSLEVGRAGFGADGKDSLIESLTDDDLKQKLIIPNASRIYMIREAFKRGWSLETLFGLTKIDPWFLDHIEELTCFEEEIRSAGTIKNLKNDLPLFTQIKEMGYSDRQIAFLLSTDETTVRKSREEINLFLFTAWWIPALPNLKPSPRISIQPTVKMMRVCRLIKRKS